MNFEDIRSKIQVPEQYREAYQRVLLAGMKVLFSKESNQIIQQELQKLEQGEPVGKVLGEGIAGLMMMLINESKGQMPPQLVVPAGLELLLQAAEYVQKTGQAKLTEKDLGEAMTTMISTLFQQVGLDPDSAFEGAAEGGAEGAQPAPGGMPAQGMIAKQMGTQGGAP